MIIDTIDTWVGYIAWILKGCPKEPKFEELVEEPLRDIHQVFPHDE